jgi:hypothetical protein
MQSMRSKGTTDGQLTWQLKHESKLQCAIWPDIVQWLIQPSELNIVCKYECQNNGKVKLHNKVIRGC